MLDNSSLASGTANFDGLAVAEYLGVGFHAITDTRIAHESKNIAQRSSYDAVGLSLAAVGTLRSLVHPAVTGRQKVLVERKHNSMHQESTFVGFNISGTQRWE
jgi:hypothetical protein